jgi:tRNA1Val (adenine37-N6)-methyltransferase
LKIPWSDRLFCFHAGLDEFVEEPEDEYDLIVSNPPFILKITKLEQSKAISPFCRCHAFGRID